MIRYLARETVLIPVRRLKGIVMVLPPVLPQHLNARPCIRPAYPALVKTILAAMSAINQIPTVAELWKVRYLSF